MQASTALGFGFAFFFLAYLQLVNVSACIECTVYLVLARFEITALNLHSKAIGHAWNVKLEQQAGEIASNGSIPW